jgi:transposase-like protein
VRGTDAGVLTALRELLAGRTEGLEALAVELFARGCSTRDVEAAFTGEDGRSLLSKSAVSELTERLWAEYEAFATRDLSEIRPLYLCIDSIAERLMPGFRRWGPAAVRCFQEDFDACIAQPQLPVSHRRMACTTNLLERLFGETLRRSKVASSVSGSANLQH